MDFDLSADQQALRDAAGDLLAGHASSAQVRAVVDAGGGLDQALWSAMVEQGWTALALPEHRGGLGLGFVEVAVLLEQVGAHVAPAPVLAQIVALSVLADAVPEWVDPLVQGTSIATIAFKPIEAASGPDERWTVTGTTEPALYAPSADVAVVRSVDAVFLVDLRDGARPPAEPAMDRTRQLGWLRFADTPAIRLGGPDLAAWFVDVAAVAFSAELLGIAARSLDLAVDYAKQRHQFGRPIGSFQAVKHRCADMLVDVEGMRSTVYYAAWALSAPAAASAPAERSVAASTAKCWCTDAAKRVVDSALQVHGGIGFTWESDVHLYLKRAQLDGVAFGDATFHRARLAGLLRERVEAGESVL